MNLKKIFNLSSPITVDIKVLSSLLILLLISISINFNARLQEKKGWDENPSIFSFEGKTLVQAGDPGYFLNMALYLKKNIPLKEYWNKLYYPAIETSEVDPPLISLFIAYLAKNSSHEEIINAGNKLVFISIILTTVSVFFLFFILGRPFEGIIASTGTGLSTVYFGRSGIGYFDTDILNLFFMYFLFSLVYLASLKQSRIKNIFFIILAGLVGKFFFIWYPKPELILMSFISLLFFTFFITKDLKKTFLNAVIFILLTGPNIYFNSLNILMNNPYLSGYMSANIKSSDLVNTNVLNFNSIFEYIGELQKKPTIDLLKIENSIIIGLFCLIGLAIWGVSNPIMFVGFAPLSFFFLLSIILGQRALFYSLPFMWFGFGYFINFMIMKMIAFRNLEINKNIIYVFTSLFLIIFTIIVTNSYPKKASALIFDSSTHKAMIKMKEIVNDKNKSVFVTPWSYGYQSIFYNDLPSLIHPGMPSSPRHYFIARAFTALDLMESKKILNYVASGKVEKINEKKLDSFVKLSKDLFNSDKANDDIYLMLTGQQRLWMNTIGSVAYWDIENNKPHYFDGKTAFDFYHLLEINCDDLDLENFTTQCSNSEASLKKNISVNLALGTWDGLLNLKRVVQITDGQVEINQEYENAEGNLVFQIVKYSKDNTSNIYLMHDAVFKSTYNKLFHLNDVEDYELVYDDYPYVKIYKVN
ncbi:dolichyl-diphosphooligosaccharide--protein glycosyltransferase subunit STT3 [Alphaproteobacteria bacterium]|nr:dolichyl-diphosphooligosaccharide--protein glycosyltransferase subunit STT3 [Alphaproteobacteria bacterium]